ncbi:MAG: type I methionyl aminopeptidase [Pseudomonadales bacterium]|nr:type I methionyl aminopeptidase [Pseudomonadales bacterium]MCP5182826.1 type I methionyl aminopeptidase [Pseudomonadales bacterium]
MVARVENEADIACMRAAGRAAAEVLEMIESHVVPGVTTEHLNQLCHDYIVDTLGCIPAPLNYRNSPQSPPYPKSICTSVNHVICHGIPTDRKPLKAGDIVNLDITVIKDGFHGDTSRTFCVGKVSPHAERLVRVAQECLYKGIEKVRPGAFLGDIGNAIETHAVKNHYSVVQEFCGHGTGRIFHDAPQVLHYGRAGTGMRLEEGMTFTIEPMINAGTRHLRILSDGWTVITRDRRLSAQWEHTLLVTGSGAEVLTLRRDESLG